MQFQDWMRETGFLHHNQRNHEVRAIDDAFYQFEKSGESKPARAALQEKLKRWVESEGRTWRNNELNRTGTVQRLYCEVFKHPATGSPYVMNGQLSIRLGPEVVNQTSTKARIQDAYYRLLGLAKRCRDEMSALQRAPQKADEGEVNRYEQWFGPVTDARQVSTVAGVYQRMVTELLSSTVITYALPQSKWYRYACVIPTDPRPLNIYLCDGFFATGGPLKERFRSSSDATAATLVHECSHMKYIGSTEDYTVGVEGCLEVAPFVAVDNADNYGCYALSFLVDLWH